MHYNYTLLHLSLIYGIGHALIKQLTEKLTLDHLEQLYSMNSGDIMRTIGCTQTQAELIVKGLSDTKLLDRELERMEAHAIKWATIFDDTYPPLLRHIYLPPTLIYWQGAELLPIDPTLAMVGSRQADAYGDHVIQQLVPDLVSQGWIIVSGGALGADSSAHQAALKAGGKTVAILGSGLLRPYPVSNKKLFEEIAASGGAVVSIFSTLMVPASGNFPARNRVISGMSRGCIVVRAAAKSGALITARFALDQGREVGAIPGSIFDSLSAGCHALIKEGAYAITSCDDVRAMFNLAPLSTAHPAVQLQISRESAEPKSLRSTIVSMCSRPISFDELAALTQCGHQDLHALLFELQLEGLIEQNYAGLWHRII